MGAFACVLRQLNIIVLKSCCCLEALEGSFVKSMKNQCSNVCNVKIYHETTLTRSLSVWFCEVAILISFVFPQFTSLHSVFHSFRGLMNSINWPASSVWVVIAQLGEHCSANAGATGSNPVEGPKIFFFGLFSQLLKLPFTAMVTYSFHLYFRSSHHFIQCIKRLKSYPDGTISER